MFSRKLNNIQRLGKCSSNGCFTELSHNGVFNAAKRQTVLPVTFEV